MADVYAWAIGRQKDEASPVEYYQDEAPGSDEPRWTLNQDECVADFSRGQMELIKESLEQRGITNLFVTPIIILKD
jgi:hypothetical protein